MRMLSEMKYGNIQLCVVKDRAAAAEHFAGTMVRAIQANNQSGFPTRLIMPVGPTGQYCLFVEKCNELRLDLSRLHVFNMDEYVGDDGCNLPESHPRSFIRFLRRHFYAPIAAECRLNLQQMHIPDARDTGGYSGAIEAVGGIDVCFGGIGINGHIAFNEALDYWELMSNEAFKQLPTRVIRLAATTKVINAVFGTGGNLQAVPNLAVTVGMKDILKSRKIVFYLDWFWQKQVLRNVLFGPITPMFPASFLRDHADVTLVVTQSVAEDPGVEPE
jgi:glucosamine-6-phosphate deaminase